MPTNTNNIIASLKQKQYTAIVHSPEYKELLTNLCKRIIRKSKAAPNEATIESYFDCELFSFFREVFVPLGFEYNPTKEAAISTVRHITKGRADTAIGALVIEFKQLATLSNEEQQKKSIDQISCYLSGMPLETEIVGFVTDGSKGCFVIRNEQGITIESFCKLSFLVLDRLVQTIIKLKLTALSSKNLVDNFCNPPDNDGIAFILVKSLYNSLVLGMTPKTQMLFNEWKELFNLAHDDVSKQQAIIDRKRALESILGISLQGKDEEYAALFALQTAYAIIVKIVAYRIVSIVRYNSSLLDFESLAQVEYNALRLQLASLEEGAIFRKYGVTNLLEGDFFSWYSTSEQWSENVAESISNVFEMLSMYSDKAVLNSGAKSADFFKELYQGMIPAEVRHSLGEYYTKRWLAQKVVDDAIIMSDCNNWKGLDPCCGSGTFLTIMIDKVLEETQDLSPKKQLQSVLGRVKGIDLNPVAVLTARVNYFINIANLLQDNEELEIPVYLGDSSCVPKRKTFDGVECLEYTIKTLRDPIEILVPVSMVRDAFEFSKTMSKIELFIHTQDDEETYNCLEALVFPCDLTNKIKKQIRKLAKGLVNLEKRNWNGIWARIVTRACSHYFGSILR